MMKIILLFLFLPTIIFAQDKNGCPPKPQKNYACGNIKEEILPRLESIDYTWDTQIAVEIQQNFKKQKDIQKAEKVAQLVQLVLNDADFWKALEHYDNYQYAKWSEKLGDTWQPISTKEITNSMLNGHPADTSRAALKTEMFSIRLYGGPFKWPRERAIAKFENGHIYNKKWFFRSASIEKIGSNWVHEYSHFKGIRHCFNCNEERDYSISYVINRIFIEVAQKYQ